MSVLTFIHTCDKDALGVFEDKMTNMLYQLFPPTN